MRLQRYLKEAISPLTSQYPILMTIPQVQKWIDKIFDGLDNYTDEIPNPKHKELKRWISKLLDDMHYWGAEWSEVKSWAWKNNVDASYPHQIKGKLKNIEKLPDSKEKKMYLSLLLEVMDIFNKFSKLKPVKRNIVPKETDKERYIRKLASSDAIKIANDALRKTVDRIEEDFVKKRMEEIKATIDKYNKADDKVKYKMRRNDSTGILSRHHFNKDIDDKAIEKVAKSEGESMKESFLMKNVDKLANILEKKGELKGKPKHNSYRKGDFFGSMNIEFMDGSKFTVVNKVVTKVNYNGTWFNQFPTTFHNVVMSDGSKMKQPSEKRMIEVFAIE